MSFDVLGLGCVAVDTLLYVREHPEPDSKVRVFRQELQCGGQTMNALVAAARLGCRCAFAGVLGEDQDSDQVLRTFQNEGIDVTHVRRQTGINPIRTTILVNTQQDTRTILYNLEGARGARADTPEELIRTTKVLFVDHFGVEGMLHAARIARRVGIPIVSDFEHSGGPGFLELLPLVDHLILSFPFAQSITLAKTPAEAIQALWNNNRQVVAVTLGTRGCWFSENTDPGVVIHQPAFRVPVVDTTGCGDTFRGAYMAALREGLNVPDRFRFASAAAAMKATYSGSQMGMPRSGQLQEFLKHPPLTYDEDGEPQS